MKFKVLHVIPAIRNGGVASVLYNLTKSQIKAGYEVGIYVSRPQLIDKKSEYENLGATIFLSSYSHRHDPRHIEELRKLFKKFDMVHVHLFPDQLFAAIAYRTLQKNERPILVTTEHSTYNNRRKYKILRYFDRCMYKPYNAIVSISEASKENLDRWLNSEKLQKSSIVITNGVDIDTYRNSGENIRVELRLDKNDKVVIMVARLIHPKNPETLLKAISLCESNVHVVFIGYGPLEDVLREMANDMNLTDRVHLLGKKDSSVPYLKGCDIGVLSTYWDGFGLVAVEYMAAGLPVLASNVDGLRSVIGDSKYLFDVLDYKTLASKIMNLLKSEEEYSKATSYFSERADLFSANKMNEKYLILYRNLIKNYGHKKNS